MVVAAARVRASSLIADCKCIDLRRENAKTTNACVSPGCAAPEGAEPGLGLPTWRQTLCLQAAVLESLMLALKMRVQQVIS